MAISLLISILLQLGIINTTMDFDEAKASQYINEVENTQGIIIGDVTVF